MTWWQPIQRLWEKIWGLITNLAVVIAYSSRDPELRAFGAIVLFLLAFWWIGKRVRERRYY